MAIDLGALKAIAKAKVEKKVQTEDDMREFIKIWWARQYNLPDNHPLFLNRTLEEHIIDFFVNDYMDDPEKLSEMTLEDQETYEEQLKREMGSDYKEKYDYLIPPDSTQEEEKRIESQVVDEDEEMETF